MPGPETSLTWSGTQYIPVVFDPPSTHRKQLHYPEKHLSLDSKHPNTHSTRTVCCPGENAAQTPACANLRRHDVDRIRRRPGAVSKAKPAPWRVKLLFAVLSQTLFRVISMAEHDIAYTQALPMSFCQSTFVLVRTSHPLHLTSATMATVSSRLRSIGCTL